MNQKLYEIWTKKHFRNPKFWTSKVFHPNSNSESGRISTPSNPTWASNGPLVSPHHILLSRFKNANKPKLMNITIITSHKTRILPNNARTMIMKISKRYYHISKELGYNINSKPKQNFGSPFSNQSIRNFWNYKHVDK